LRLGQEYRTASVRVADGGAVLVVLAHDSIDLRAGERDQGDL
jgi:hypothetical protein